MQENRFLYAKTHPCRGCKATTESILYRQFNAGGHETFFWKCGRCEAVKVVDMTRCIPKKLVESWLTSEEIVSLPYAPNERGPENRCVKCGVREAELHHWAPRARFGNVECELWPKDYLCKSCHDRWHELVTPKLVH